MIRIYIIMESLKTNVKTIKKTVTFDDMKLKDMLLRGIYSYGFEKPSDIQQIGVMPVVSGQDSIIQAKSGTGKTGTFSIAMLQVVDETKKDLQAIVLSPTRELAKQTYKVLLCLGDYLGTRIVLCTGGGNVKDDETSVREAHILVATPGRLLDIIRRKLITTKMVKLLVIDEADEMLNIGFKSQIYDIYQTLPETIQTALYSATMPQEVLELTKKFMNDPIKILLSQDEVSLDGLTQYYISLNNDDEKLLTILDLFEAFTKISQAMIFCSSKRRVDWLKKKLEENKFTVSAIHSDMSQQERDEIMKQFRSGNSRILVSTDLLARGIDVQQTSLVMNYDMPKYHENYMHRIGRTARYGKKGVAINLVTNQEYKLVKEIEKIYGVTVEPLPGDVNSIF
jgi:translation initiation factor 4A